MQRIFGRSRVGLVSSFTLSRRWASNSGTDGSSSSSSNNNNKKKDGTHTTTTPTQSKRGAAFATTTDSTPPSHPLHAPESVYAHSDLTKDLRAPRAEVHSKFNQQQQKVPTQESGVRRTATKPIILRAAASADAAGANNKSDGASSSSTPSSPPTSSTSSSSPSPSAVAERVPGAKQVVRTQDGPTVPDYGPLRATGLWSVDEVVDEQRSTVEFRRIDDIETDIAEQLREPDEALVPYAEEERWKHQLMFVHKFFKTPKHMTWKELGEEIQCLDCVINLDEHRPEEIFTINFFFTDKATGQRDVLWSARNDVSYSEGFTDLLAAVGACLGRSDVHRTIRFDDGHGTLRDVTIRKRSRYTSDITLAFRPPESYDKYRRKVEQDEYESSMEAEGLSTWGFHPQMMDPEYNDLDFQDPEGTYTVAISAHGFSFLFLRAIKRLLSRPMEEYYRPSQRMRTAKVRTTDDIGFAHAMKGWMGIEDQIYPHFTPIEALQDHWLGKDAPFTLCSIINKLREMAYLKKENPELQSWLSVRHHDTHAAIRNLGVKMLGVGASTLFIPSSHNPTVNRLLPRHQQRRLESRFSINAVLGLPDETRRLEEFKRLTGSPSSLMDSAANKNNNTTDEKVMEEVRASSGSTDKTHNTDVKQS